jgi:hypothetical protein
VTSGLEKLKEKVKEKIEELLAQRENLKPK